MTGDTSRILTVGADEIIREDLRFTVTTARDCNLEIIMKDVHTLCGDPLRLARWVQLARETCARSAG